MFILQNQYISTVEISAIVFELLRVLILCILQVFPVVNSILIQYIFHIFVPLCSKVPHRIVLPLAHPSLVLFRHRLILVVSSVLTHDIWTHSYTQSTGNCLSMHCKAFPLTAISIFKVFSWSFSIFTIRAIYISAATSLVRCNLQANCYN